MAKIHILFFLLSISVYQLNAHANATLLQKVVLLTSGATTSLGGQQEISDIQVCLQESKELINEFKQVFEDISHFHNFTEIIEIFLKISSQIGGVISECKQASNESIAFYSNIYKHFSDSKLRLKGIENLIVHYEDVIDQLELGFYRYFQAEINEDYFVSGTKFGNFLSIFVYGNFTRLQNNPSFQIITRNPLFLKQQINNFFQGFLDGYQVNNIKQLIPATCINDLQEIQNKIKNEFQLQNIESIGDLFKIIKEFSKYSNILNKYECLNTASEYISLIQQIESSLTNPLKIWQGIENISQNKAEIIQSINVIKQKMLHGKETEAFLIGKQIGNILRIYVKGDQNGSNNLNNFKQLEGNNKKFLN